MLACWLSPAGIGPVQLQITSNCKDKSIRQEDDVTVGTVQEYSAAFLSLTCQELERETDGMLKRRLNEEATRRVCNACIHEGAYTPPFVYPNPGAFRAAGLC